MTKLVVVAAALAMSGLVSLAHAEMNSGSMTEGQKCWKTATNNSMGFGYWDQCPTPPKAAPVRHSRKTKAKRMQ